MADEVFEEPTGKRMTEQEKIDDQKLRDRNSGRAALTHMQITDQDGKTGLSTVHQRELSSMLDDAPTKENFALERLMADLAISSDSTAAKPLPKVARSGKKHGPYHGALGRLGFSESQSEAPITHTPAHKGPGIHHRAPTMSMALNGPNAPSVDFAL